MITTLLIPFLILPALVSAASPTVSHHSLFRAIELRVVPKPKQADPPICCLKPQNTGELVEADILLSFEQWKEKQLAAANQSGAPVPAAVASAIAVENNHLPPFNVNEPIPSPSPALTPLIVSESPLFRVPLTDRFNYASLDCSARVHLSHRSAKSASSILSSKRDRYMLSPCNRGKEKQFVVIELCEDVRIDTVQLANFEFFSGVFKEFTVSVAKTQNDQAEWTDAGTYIAKNIRGVQTFHPPRSLRGFYRYIRIDFKSHYGNEYYCPITLLRVYGLTHLEEWKLEVWEEESRAKGEVGGRLLTEGAEVTKVVDNTVVETILSTASPTSATMEPAATSASEAPTSNIAATTVSQPVGASAFPSSKISPPEASDTAAPITSQAHEPSGSISSSLAVSTAGTDNATSSTATPIVHANLATTTIIAASHAIVPASPSGGESIYRTIMNRLAALESNHTLYVRYVEEHTAGVREMLRRISEDLGRVDGLGKAQLQTFQRTLGEWEKEKLLLLIENSELVDRLDSLTEEIVLEKRLGIAQLCLLMAVLVFMALTRGSRGEPILEHGPGHSRLFNKSMREWGQRHLSFSGDWVSRFKTTSRSISPDVRSSRPSASVEPKDGEAQYDFPSSAVMSPKSAQRSGLYPKDRRPRKISLPRSLKSQGNGRSHSNTPVSRTFNLHSAHPRTPVASASAITYTMSTAVPYRAPTDRPKIARASSSGPVTTIMTKTQNLPVHTTSHTWMGPVPRSARRWARTAHLHEVQARVLDASVRSKPEPGADGSGKENENENGGIMSTSSASDDAESFPPSLPSTSPTRRPGLALDNMPLDLDSVVNGKGKRTGKRRELLQVPILDDSPTRRAYANVNGSESDLWEDTDTDGGELSYDEGFS